MAIEIQLTKNLIAIVDDVDSDLAQFKWHCNNGVKGNTYAVRAIYPTGKLESKTRVWMHRLVLERSINRPLGVGEKADHINGDVLDNRRANLRVATIAENSQNKRVLKNNKSGFKGVVLNKKNKSWMAIIRISGEQKYLGSFDTPEEAHAAYCEAGRKYFGEFFNPG